MEEEQLSNKITINDENGKEVVYNILFKHFAPEFDKTFVVFVEDGTNNASAAIVVEKEGGEGLEEIKSQEEWTMLEGLLNDFVEKQAHMHDSCSSGGCSSCSSCSSCEDFDDEDFDDSEEEEDCCCSGSSCGN